MAGPAGRKRGERRLVAKSKAKPTPGRMTDITRVDGEPGMKYRWVDTSNRRKLRTAQMYGYEPVPADSVDFEGMQEGKVRPIMGEKAADGTVRERGLLLMQIGEKEWAKRQAEKARENARHVQRDKVKYIEEQVKAGAMTDRQAEEAMRSGIDLEERTHG